MSGRKCTFRQSDLTRALRAARAAGVDIFEVKINTITGNIVIVTNDAQLTEQVGDLDGWLVKHGACAT